MNYKGLIKYGGCSSMVECATVARVTRVRFTPSAFNPNRTRVRRVRAIWLFEQNNSLQLNQKEQIASRFTPSAFSISSASLNNINYNLIKGKLK
jgi:hypothetical protein